MEVSLEHGTRTSYPADGHVQNPSLAEDGQSILFCLSVGLGNFELHELRGSWSYHCLHQNVHTCNDQVLLLP